MARTRSIRPRARSAGLLVQPLPEEVLVYDLERNRAHCLSPAAAAVWRACDGTRTPEEIARHAARAAGTPIDVSLVRWTVAGLASARLVDGPARPEVDASRREWLKKAAALAGLSVLSVGIPTSAMAATCISAADCRNRNRFNCGGRICCDGPNAGQPCVRRGFCRCG